MNKKDFKKLNDWLWEIPKSFRSDMRVPARIYVSEKMLEDVENEALQQLVNTTTMQGIVKYAIAMPDIHSGYGPPIGGVGAMRLSEGVISPGFVGYDENCLPTDAKILLENNSWITIGELKTLKNCKVKVGNFKKDNLEDASVFNFFKRYNNPTIYEIITYSGEKIRATDAHPIQTKEGMKEVKFLNEQDWVLMYPFKGVEYKEPPKEIILDEKKLKKILIKLGKNNQKGRTLFQILDQLKSRGFLPLSYNSPALSYILKLMGYIFGDGAISFGKNPQIHFYGQHRDLKEIQKDIIKLKFKPSRIYSRKRNHSITTFYGTYKFSRTEYSIKINSSSLTSLLMTLGTPYGLKSHNPYRIPKWIFKCPLWQKGLFLAAFFGAELSKPKTLNKYNFYALQLNMQKVKGLERNAKLFLKDVAILLKEFGIETHSVKKVPGYEYKGPQGETIGFRLQIKEKVENLIRFFETINYEYNQKRHKEACLAANYLKRKLKIVEIRNKAREEIKRLYRKRGDFKELALEIIKKCDSEYVNLQFLYHSIFKENSHGVRRKRGNPRVSFNFPSFEEFKKKYKYGNKGLVWDEIEKIEKIPYHDFVYDFTVNHPAHNFLANSFVVSNCGVRLLLSDYTEKEISPYLDELASEIQKEVPSGLGKGRQSKLSIEEINRVLEGGAAYLVKNGKGEKEDIENCEEGGFMKEAETEAVSYHAKNRGRDQLGTLGSGNHFVEIQEVAEIFDKKIAEIFGLIKNQVVIFIHTGSRGLGHQNCTDYLRLMAQAMSKYGIELPDRELACVPFGSPEGQRFFSAMAGGANYAWANRQMITFYIRKAWKSVLGKGKLKMLYDVAHNIAKIEEHEVNGIKLKLCVHRKGATRAFPPGHPEIPKKYQETGQPVLIPGSMGTASYVLAGDKEGKESWYSASHGAGRAMSRHQALRRVSGRELVKELESRGVLIKCRSLRSIAEEAPIAYKDVDKVVEIVHNAGLSKKVAKLVPMAVIKGE